MCFFLIPVCFFLSWGGERCAAPDLLSLYVLLWLCLVLFYQMCFLSDSSTVISASFGHFSVNFETVDDGKINMFHH